MQVFYFSGCGCISCPVDCSPEVLRRLKEFFWFADFEHYNLQLVHLGSGRRRILTHLDIDNVTLFIILFHHPVQRDWRGLDMGFYIRTDPVWVGGELRGRIS